MDTIAFTEGPEGWDYMCDINGMEFTPEAPLPTLEAAAERLRWSIGVPVDPHADSMVRYGRTLTITVTPA